MKPLFSALLTILAWSSLSLIGLAQQTNRQTMTDDEMNQLIDSLVVNQASSDLIINFNYQNRTFFAGRDLGVKQWNSTCSFSYYHKSGLYADFSSFLYGKSSPVWQMSAVSLGYMKDLNNWSVSLDAGRMIETNPDPNYANQVPNWVSASLSYTFDKLVPMVDYTLLFGNETAKRLRTGFSYYQSFINVGFFDRISLVPKVTAVFGNQDITYAQYWTGANLYSTDTGTSTTTKKNPFNQVVTKLGKKQQAQTGTQSHFGIMATDVALSVSATKYNIRLNFTPHLVKPIKLYTGEDISTTWKFFFSTSLSYTLRN